MGARPKCWTTEFVLYMRKLTFGKTCHKLSTIRCASFRDILHLSLSPSFSPSLSPSLSLYIYKNTYIYIYIWIYIYIYICIRVRLYTYFVCFLDMYMCVHMFRQALRTYIRTYRERENIHCFFVVDADFSFYTHRSSPCRPDNGAAFKLWSEHSDSWRKAPAGYRSNYPTLWQLRARSLLVFNTSMTERLAWFPSQLRSEASTAKATRLAQSILGPNGPWPKGGLSLSLSFSLQIYVYI